MPVKGLRTPAERKETIEQFLYETGQMGIEILEHFRGDNSAAAEAISSGKLYDRFDDCALDAFERARDDDDMAEILAEYIDGECLDFQRWSRDIIGNDDFYPSKKGKLLIVDHADLAVLEKWKKEWGTYEEDELMDGEALADGRVRMQNTSYAFRDVIKEVNNLDGDDATGFAVISACVEVMGKGSTPEEAIEGALACPEFCGDIVCQYPIPEDAYGLFPVSEDFMESDRLYCHTAYRFELTVHLPA